MVEINLNRREFTGNVITGKKELSQIIISSEKEFRKKYGKIEPNLEFRNLLDVLIGTYYSIEDQLNYVKNIHVPADTKTKLSKYFSLYNSSNAVLNLLNPKNTEVQKNKEPYISKKEIDDRCRFSFLSSILNKLENSVVMDHENNPNSLLTSFFLDLRDISKSTLDEIADLDSLKDIDIKIEGLDLSEKVHYTLGKTEQQNTQVKNELGKHIPKDIPEYIPDNKVDFHDCIGNQEQIMDLLDYVTRVMRYNHEKKENEFKDIGIGFQNNIVIYGPPGTGKTMAVNAIAEWAKKIAEQFGKPLHITDMIKDTLTCYKDMSSKILEEFFKKEEEGDGIYINIFDEAGGGKLYNSNKNGDGSQEDRKFLETAKKVMRREYSGNVINIIITNYTDESSLEAAFGQAFEKIKIEGPQTAEDFGTILKNQFREYASKIGLVDKDIDYSRLGSIFTKYKKLEEKLSDKGFYVTGRTVRQVCKSFKPEKRIHETPEIIDNNKYSGEKFYNSCKKIHGRITEEKLETAIIQTLENEIESKGYRIDKNKKIAAD